MSIGRRFLTRLFLSTFRVPRDAVRYGFKKHRDRVALRLLDPGAASLSASPTFAALEDRVLRLVAVFASFGVRRGGHVMAVLGDGAELIEVRLAALEAGVVLSGLPLWATPESVAAVPQLGTPDLLIVDGRIAPELEAALARLGVPPERVLKTGDTYERRVAGAAPLRSRDEVKREDVAGVGFTSGTTGEPKVLRVPHGAFMKSLTLTATNVVGNVRTREVMLSCIPLTGAGSGLVLPFVLTGATLVIPAASSTSALLAALVEERVTRAFMTPSQLIDLLDEPGFTPEKLPALRNVIYGTAPMPVPKLEEAVARFGPIFQQGYGMAEVLPPVSLLQMGQHVVDGHERKPAPRDVLRSCGYVVPEVKVRVVDGALRDVPAGTIGEVLVNSPTLFQGYWRLGGVDRSVFHEGFLRTGDFGSLRDDGILTILDRRPDLLVRDGETHYPRLIEEAAHDHRAVKEACAVQKQAEAPIVMFLSLRRMAGDAPAVVAEVEELLRERLPPSARPHEIRVLPALPRSPLQKVIRRGLRPLI